MNKHKIMLVATMTAAAALLLAACGGIGAGDTVRLAVNPWTGSAVNAAVAKAVLEQEMDATVELVDIDENAQWAGLAAGDLDASLELWLSGHGDNYQTYVEEEGTVEDLGPLGAVGDIGWYVPTYLVEENAEIATWEGLNEHADMFATAETGDQGQFLAGDPSYVSYDEHIIRNLGLDFQVVQSGSEAALLTALESAYERQEPLLFYFWEPHWAHAVYDLTQVELPAYTDECGEGPDEEWDCDYPEEDLLKIVNADLSERLPDIYAFLDNMTITNEQQAELAVLVDVDGMDPEEAGRQWAEEHPEVWQAWLP
jgi:glycine betaine/proline transport system substrate-binding protein